MSRSTKYPLGNVLASERRSQMFKVCLQPTSQFVCQQTVHCYILKEVYHLFRGEIRLGLPDFVEDVDQKHGVAFCKIESCIVNFDCVQTDFVEKV